MQSRQRSINSYFRRRYRIADVSYNGVGQTGLVLAGVGLHDLVVDPHVGDGHAVLCQRARLVRADRRRGAQCLDCLEVLHQTVLTGHPLRRQRQTDLHAPANNSK